MVFLKLKTLQKNKLVSMKGLEWFNYDFYVYVRSDLMSRIVKNCRGEKKRREKKIDGFRINLGFEPHYLVVTKEDSIISKITKVFAKD